MTVQTDDPRPPYVQVADALRTEIETGHWRDGQRLPSVRDLAKRFEVAPATIQNALRILRDQSLIFSGGNQGTFVGSSSTTQPDEPIEHRMRAVEQELQRLAHRVAELERVKPPT